jgi:hypothetical protein
MSKRLGLSIEIGGTLLATKVNDFLSILTSDISDIELGPVNSKELNDRIAKENKSIKWYGAGYYSLCDNLCAFCIKNKMSYKHYQDGGGIYNNYITLWNPKIKKPTTYICSVNRELLISNNQIKKILDRYYKDHSTIELIYRLKKFYLINNFILPPFKIK